MEDKYQYDSLPYEIRNNNVQEKFIYLSPEALHYLFGLSFKQSLIFVFE